MSTFVKLLIVLSIACFTQVAVADTAKRNIAVTVSADVQQQIQDLALNERRRVEAAIKMGNQFVPYYFDGSANNITDEQSVKIWRRNIRPLVNKDFIEWGDMVAANGSGLQLIIGGKPVSGIGLCPNAELIAFRIDGGNIALKYRAQVIGETQGDRFKLFSPFGGYLLDDQVDYQEVQVDLDAHNKVDSVAPKYWGFFVTTDFYMGSYEGHIRLLTIRLPTLSPDEQLHTKEEILQYQKWIKLFKEQDATVCKAN